MPQGRRPTAEEVLGLQPKRPTAEEVLGIAPQRPSAEQVLGVAAQPQDDLLTRFRRNVGIAAEQGFTALKDKGAALAEIVGGAAAGDFRPALEAGESIARGAGALLMGGNPSFVTPAAANRQALAEVGARTDARRSASGDTSFSRRAEEMRQLEARAQAYDPSLTGRITRGAVREAIKLAPTLIAGAVSGGSIPAMTAATAASSLDEPENLALATGLSAIPIGRAVRSVTPTIERALGRGAAQIVEAEARQAGGALVRTGAAVNAEAMRSADAGLNAAISQAAKEVPESVTRRIASEVSAFPRAMMSSLDISAPGRQGLILAAAPSRWGAAVKAGGRMFQAFRKESYNRINKEIANHADAAVADDAGLFLAFKQSEEFFTSKLASKVPGVQASQRSYETYLDSLRMSTFSQYKKVIDKSGLTGDQASQAYKAAAKWINVATGRGSFGRKFDDAIPFLSQFLFAPRYAASRFNVLNPKMYIDNFRNPATRVVLKEQMKDLAQYLGLVATTYGLAKAAGADVNLNPGDRDFLKIRAGNKTFDPGAGLVQVMRFASKVGYDMFRASKGEKAEPFKDAGSATLNFIRSKTAPIPSYAWDFFSRRTYIGNEFTTAGQRAKGAIERVVPLAWADFTEALYNEGLGGAAGTLPGFVGVGVQTYTQPGGFIEQAAPLLREYTRAKRQLPEIRRINNESQEQFNTRLKVFGEALSTYGTQLVESEEYRNADAATKDAALNLLPRRISSALIKQNEAWQLAPRVIMSDVRENLQERRR